MLSNTFGHLPSDFFSVSSLIIFSLLVSLQASSSFANTVFSSFVPSKLVPISIPCSPLPASPPFPHLLSAHCQPSSEFSTLRCCSYSLINEEKAFPVQWITESSDHFRVDHQLGHFSHVLFLGLQSVRFLFCFFLPRFQTLYFCHKVNQCISIESLTKWFGKSQTLKDYWPALNKSALSTRDRLPNASQREQSLLCKLHVINYSISMPSGRWHYQLPLVSVVIKHFLD